jgi:hypothetical protein
LWQYFSHVLKAPPGVRLARRRDLTRNPALREECRGPRGQPRGLLALPLVLSSA